MSLSGLIPTIHWLEEVFDRIGTERSYGGAVAYNFYGPPRLTQDVDVLVLVEGLKAAALIDELAKGGCLHGDAEPRTIEPKSVLAEWRASPFFSVFLRERIRIEIFAPWHAFHRRVLDRSPRRDLGGRRVPLHSPEDLIVFKKIFDRPKDIQDIKAILLSQRDRLDTARILADAKQLLPEPAWKELDDLIKRYHAPDE